MKKKLIALTVLVLTFIMLCSCGRSAYGGTQSPDTTGDAAQNTYIGIIDLLEGEIEQLKKDQLKNSAEYEATIAELEKQIAELMESSNTSKPSDTTEDKTPSPFTYKVVENSAVITSYSGEYSVLVIPETIDGYTVTEISDSVFSGNTKLTSVYVPGGVSKIGWFAFSGCTSLKSVTLPESVKEIGYDSFAYCTRLTLHCSSGSYSEKYAKSYGISCIVN